MPGNPTRGLARIMELSAINGATAGLNYRSANWPENYDNPNTWRASASYVTGGHSFKVGYVGGYLREDIENHGNDLNLTYTFNNGRPVVADAEPAGLPADRPGPLRRALRAGSVDDGPDDAPGRAAIRPRVELFAGPDDRSGSHRRADVPEHPVDLRQDRWRQLQGHLAACRMGLRCLRQREDGDQSERRPLRRSGEQPQQQLLDLESDRAHRDDGQLARLGRFRPSRNGDFVPQCDFTNNAANGECLATNATTFGTAQRTTAAIDPALLNGWGIRPNDWQIGASIQQQIMPRVSVEIGYFRRWLQNFTATDNTLVTPADFTPFTVTAPSDSRLPGGGGYPVPGLFNVVQSKFGQTSNNVTDSANFGDQYQRYNGMLINISARPRNGLTFQGGINTGKTVNDYCANRAELPELSIGILGATINPTNPFCHVEPGFVTKMSGVASYIVPKIDVLIAGTIRSDQGAPLRAIWNAPTATVVNPALGRPVSGGAATLAIDLVAPGEVWGDRVNELDFRFGKILNFGRMRTNVGIDIYNVLNQAAVLTYNQTFAPAPGQWLAPTSVLTPRFVKVSAQIDF